MVFEKIGVLDYGIVGVVTLCLIILFGLLGNFVPAQFQLLYWFSIVFSAIMMTHPEFTINIKG